MNLSGQQRKNLLAALNDAFRDKASLEQMLAFELDKNLDTIAGGNSLQDIVFNLIKIAEAQGWVEDLVYAALRSNSGNPLLIVIAEELLTIKSSEPHKVPSPNILPEQSTQTQKILILAALPDRLRLDQEIRGIEEAIKRAVKRDSFEIKIRTAVRPIDVRRAIAEERPQIVHFCGHGMEDGSLVLEDDGGNHKPVLPTGLAALFKLHSDYVECVLLNACYSSKSAEVISQYINYVIGMNQPIEDKAAIVFAQGFYDGLGYDNINNQQVIQRAYDEGIVAIELENLFQENFLPVLWENGKQKPEPTEEKEVSTLSHRLGYQPNIQTNFEEIIETQSPLQDELDDDLSSECGQDYTRLRNLLKEKQWKEADQETYRMMIQAVGKKEGDWFVQDELLNFPCKDLRTIDRLWVKYSDGRFGFSVQKQIYLRVGGKADGEYYQEAWLKFGDSVGWRVKGTVILYNEGIFDTSSPLGHLPVGWVLCCVCGWYASGVSSLASRLVNCNL